MQSPSDEGTSPKTAEDPEETTGGEGGSGSPHTGRGRAGRIGSSREDAPVRPNDESSATPASALEPAAGGTRGSTRIERHASEVGSAHNPKTDRAPAGRANRIELNVPDPLPLEPSLTREERGVHRVEVVDSPLGPPETWAAAKNGPRVKSVEIPHEIDSLLGITHDERREDSGEQGPAGSFTRMRPTVADASSSTRLGYAEGGAADGSKTPSPHADHIPPATRHRLQPNGINAHPGRNLQTPERPNTLVPPGSAPNPLENPPGSKPRAMAAAPPEVEPVLQSQGPGQEQGPIVDPAKANAPAAASVPAPNETSPSTVPMGIDSVSDGNRGPTITEATNEPTPPAAKRGKKNQKTVVGSRTRHWLAWFLGNPAHVESVITPVPALGPNTTQVTLREMVPATAYARVLFNTERARHHYLVIEPPLDERETRSLQFIKEVLLRTLDIELEIVERSVAPESLNLLDERVRKVVRDYRMDLSQTSLRRLVYYLRRDFTGYGPVDVMMHDPDIEDISCDGPGTNVFLYHRRYGSMESNVMFATSEELDGFVIRMAQRSGKQITIADPLLDSSLPDGSRLQATLGREVTDNGSTFTIRRFRDNPLSPIDLVRMGTMSADLLAYCWIVVQFGANVMLAGGTASGKTTTLNTISLFIPRQAKIVSIEDTREINLPHKNWVRSVTRGGTRGNDQKRVDMFDLLTAALRQRPEYILVGEVRGKEATVAFQAMATGHTVLGTIHADSPRSVVYRLESEPINIPRIVIQSLDVILMQALLNVNGRRQRRIQEVAEIVGIDPASKELLTHGVFLRNPTNDQLHYTGRSYKLQRIAQRNNWSAKDLDAEMKRRAQIINALVGMPNVTFDQIGQLFSTYENRPDAVEAELNVLRAGAPSGGTK